MHTTFIDSGVTTLSQPHSESQPSPHRLQRAQSTAKNKMLSKFPCLHNLTLWCGRRETSLQAIITLLMPALGSCPPNILWVRTAHLTLSAQHSHSCERLLLMNRIWKSQQEIKGLRDTFQLHQSVAMLQCIQGFLWLCVALQPDMKDATTDQQAHHRGRENEAVEGGCCYMGSKADGVGCLEGEPLRGVCKGSWKKHVDINFWKVCRRYVTITLATQIYRTVRLLKPAAYLAHKIPFIFMRGMRIEWYDVLHNRINVQTNRRKGSSLRGSGWQHCRRLSPKSLINPNIGFSKRSMCRADASSNTVTANTVQRCGYRTRVHTVALMLQSYHQGTDWDIVCHYITILMIYASYIGRKHGFVFARGV